MQEFKIFKHNKNRLFLNVVSGFFCRFIDIAMSTEFVILLLNFGHNVVLFV